MQPPSPNRLEWSTRRSAEGLRTRYRPDCRINHAFFTVVPWLDTLLLGACIVLAVGSRALVPGVGIELPAAPFDDGLNSDLVLVVNPLPGDPASGPASASVPSVMVFFNDDRFNLANAHQTDRLQEALARTLERAGARDALLYIDRRVAHGDVVRLIGLLRETGVRRASIVAKTP